MSDDLNKKISQIAELLGQDGIPDNVKGLISLFAGSMGKEETPSKAIEPPIERKEEKSTKNDMDENVEMLRKFKRIMDRANYNDPRINLLNAVKPFLNNRRQKRLNDCIKLLHMSMVTRLLDENIMHD